MTDLVEGQPGDDPFWEPPLFDVGPWLKQRRGLLETNECRWLEVLHDFDRDGLYACDGHLTAATWLIWTCGMARSTAYEKLRMAHELARRSIVKDAFARGEISYSAARAICSLDDPHPATDSALVNLARHGTVHDVEAAVRYYQLLMSQDLPPFEPERREVSSRKGHYGLGQLRAVLSNDELAFVEAVIKAFMAAKADAQAIAGGPFDDQAETGQSAQADNDPSAVPTPAAADVPDPAPAAPASAAGEETGQSARADTNPSDEEEEEDDWRVAYGTSRADALMDIFSVALANLGGGHVAGADRYMIHVVADTDGLRGDPGGTAELVDGSLLPEGVAARMACDASFVAHLLADGSEPLALGRRVRDWTPAQRRAIRVRDRGRCRFPGCQRGVTDIHHITPWSDGGSTDLANGALLCTRHHVLAHQGFTAEGNGNGELLFRRPDRSVLGVSRPSRRPATLRKGSEAA